MKKPMKQMAKSAATKPPTPAISPGMAAPRASATNFKQKSVSPVKMKAASKMKKKC